MERNVYIRKKKSALIQACAEAGIFVIIALLFVIFPQAGGQVRITAVILFLALSVPGWIMIADYFLSALIISDEGITAVRPFGRKKMFTWQEITSVAVRKNFVFVYGRNNKVLTSLDVSLAEYPETLAILRDHHVGLHDHNYRKQG